MHLTKEKQVEEAELVKGEVPLKKSSLNHITVVDKLKTPTVI